MTATDKVNWNDVETWQRVVAALLATGIKPDLKQTATFFGTTYDTLENRFRKIKKDAQVLKDEVNSGQRGEVTAPSRARSAPSTPRKAKTPKKDALGSKTILPPHSLSDLSLIMAAAVTNGRVAKPTPRSGKKKNIKQEDLDDSFSSTMVDEIPDPTHMSFDMGKYPLLLLVIPLLM